MLACAAGKIDTQAIGEDGTTILDVGIVNAGQQINEYCRNAAF